jgi:hypothetical protein
MPRYTDVFRIFSGSFTWCRSGWVMFTIVRID